jgi:xylan 1,4-beta-xylosidase
MLGGDWLQTASDGALPLAEMLEGHASTHSDINAVATRTGKQIDILVWNYDDRDIAAPPANISLHLDGLTSDKVRMKRFLIDHDHSNAYTAWLAMGSPQQPSAEQRGSLIEASTLDQVDPQQPLAIRDGSATLNFPLARQGVSLVQITIP